MRVFAVSGYSKTGKTAVVESLTSFFSSEGYSVATIKDSGCRDLHAGDETSDTGRHRQSGASASILLSDGLTSIIYGRRLRAAEALKFLNHDVVIMEGFKALRIPKIITASDTAGADAVFCEEVFAFSGRFALTERSYRGRPVYDCFADTARLAELALNSAASGPDAAAALAGEPY